jgi:hypothetical protein
MTNLKTRTREAMMKDPKIAATMRQRNYALRRVLYDTLIAAKAVLAVRTSGRDYSAKEAAKAAGLIMARNLDDFFFKQNRVMSGAGTRKGKVSPQDAYRKDDDIFVGDFGLRWTPDQKAMLSDTDYERINKLVGHIVADSPKPFIDSVATAIIERHVQVAVEFVQTCLSSGAAAYTGKAEFYVRRLNGTLGKLGLPRLTG